GEELGPLLEPLGEAEFLGDGERGVAAVEVAAGELAGDGLEVGDGVQRVPIWAGGEREQALEQPPGLRFTERAWRGGRERHAVLGREREERALVPLGRDDQQLVHRRA